MSGRVFALLVTFRRPKELALTLHSLAADPCDLELLLVVDHEPTSASHNAVAEYGGSHPVEYLPTNDNTGPAGGMRLGIERLLELADDRDWILALDDDDPPYRALLSDLRQAANACAAAHPQMGGLGLVGARYDRRWGKVARLDDDELHGFVPVDYVGGGQLPLYRAGALRKVGAHRAELFFGFEDLDQGLRLAGAGHPLFVSGALMAEARRHFGHSSADRRRTNRSSARDWRAYYSVRNVIIIAREHASRIGAIAATVRFAVASPLILFVTRKVGVNYLRLSAAGGLDAWRGRLGKVIEPEG